MKNLIFFVLLFASSTSNCFTEELKNSKVLKTQVGRDIIIVLNSNPTTAYQWQIAEPLDENILKLISSEYKADKVELVGSAGKQIWRFKALKPADATISFKYVRPWEKNAKAQKEESYRVIINR